VTTPLSQTNFLPDLTQVKVLRETTDVFPALLHAAPALAAAFTGIEGRNTKSESKVKNVMGFLLMNKA